ncbi:unnamed protein product, partial [Amoebophrya sp. A120]
ISSSNSTFAAGGAGGAPRIPSNASSSSSNSSSSSSTSIFQNGIAHRRSGPLTTGAATAFRADPNSGKRRRTTAEDHAVLGGNSVANEGSFDFDEDKEDEETAFHRFAEGEYFEDSNPLRTPLQPEEEPGDDSGGGDELRGRAPVLAEDKASSSSAGTSSRGAVQGLDVDHHERRSRENKVKAQQEQEFERQRAKEAAIRERFQVPKEADDQGFVELQNPEEPWIQYDDEDVEVDIKVHDARRRRRSRSSPSSCTPRERADKDVDAELLLDQERKPASPQKKLDNSTSCDEVDQYFNSQHQELALVPTAPPGSKKDGPAAG